MWSEAVDDRDRHPIRVDYSYPQHPRNQPWRGYAQPQHRPYVSDQVGERLRDLDVASADELNDSVLKRNRDSLVEVEGE